MPNSLAPCLHRTLDGALLLDAATGQILDTNNAYCTLIGLPREQLLSRRLQDLEVSEAPGQGEARLETVQRDGSCRYRCTHRHADGHARSVEVSASLAGSEILAIVRDRTEDVRLLATLEASEARFRRSFEHATSGMALTAIDGRLTRVNPAFCDLLGYPRAELEAMSFMELTHPDDRGKSAEAVRRAFAGESDTLRFEKRYLKKDGGFIWADVNAILLRDAGGAPMHFVTHIVDITERRRLEEAARASRVEVSTIYEHAPTMLILVDHDGRLEKVNPATAKFADREPSELLGHRFGQALRCIHSLDDPRGCGFGPACGDCVFRRTVRDTVLHGTIHRNVEAVLPQQRVDGVSERPVFLSSIPVAFDGRKRILLSIVDRTEQMRLEEELRQAQRLESIGRLAGGIAHDFNNLLSVILTGTELATAGLGADDPRAADLAAVERAATRAASLTTQLLAFSRRQTLQPRVFDLNTLLEKLQEMLRRLVPASITLNLRLAKSPIRVRADWAQIEQVVMNLVVNARDAMPSGGTVTIATAQEDPPTEKGRGAIGVPPGAYACLRVSDDGPGMTAEVRAHAFEPFFTTKPTSRGTGLGLSTVFGIIKQHGGYTWLDSTPGGGTRFRIYLPATGAGDGADGASAAKKPPPALAPSDKETILVVEDEEAVRSLVERVLQRQGYAVLCAPDGLAAQAISRAHVGPITLLLTDVMMPRCDGPTCAAAITVERPDIRVLYMSGYAEDALGERGVISDTVRFLSKPFTIASLSQAVRAAIGAPTAVRTTGATDGG